MSPTSAASPGPSLYDLLDVEPSASDAEITAAWTSATAGLGPTDRRFRAYNQAAEVLLDPERRAAYDAERSTEQAPDPTPEQGARHLEAGERVEPDEPAAERRAVREVPAPALVGLAVLTALAAALAGYQYAAVPSDAAIQDAARAAQVAAERAVVPVLSYDCADLEASRRAATSYLTPGYRAEYEKFFSVIEDNCPRTRTAVTTEVVSSGIVRVSADGTDRAQFLLFVDRPTTNKAADEPVIYRDQVTVTMARIAGSWLVDGLKTSPAAP